MAKRLNAEQRFVRAALKAWIKHMRELGTQPLHLSSLRMSREVVEALVEELVSAVRRPAFIEQLDAAVMRRIFNGVRRDQIVQRQVLTVQLAMRDFLSWFDLLGKPVSERPTALLVRANPYSAPTRPSPRANCQCSRKSRPTRSRASRSTGCRAWPG